MRRPRCLVPLLGVTAALAVTGCKDKAEGAGSAGHTRAAPPRAIDVDALAAVTAPGFTFSTTSKRRDKVTLAFRGEVAGAKVKGLIDVGKCVPADLCPTLDVDAFRANKDLEGVLSSALAHDPRTVFEIDRADLGGREVITVYRLGFVETGETTVSDHGLDVWWNDGTNMLMINIYDGEVVHADSFEEFQARATRPGFDAAAAALVEAFDGTL
ncbi:MAG: hypothetical protein H6708_32175 [Kofleriaceae bacterium]|nr:hypothetical protein [Kofleriaceae bacterium]